MGEVIPEAEGRPVGHLSGQHGIDAFLGVHGWATPLGCDGLLYNMGEKACGGRISETLINGWRRPSANSQPGNVGYATKLWNTPAVPFKTKFYSRKAPPMTTKSKSQSPWDLVNTFDRSMSFEGTKTNQKHTELI